MISLFKDLFTASDSSQSNGLDKDFERLMDNLRDDDLALVGIEAEVREGFRQIDEEVKKIGEGVDETLEKTVD